MSAIARALGVSQPALYRYYPSRDDLVTALIVDAFNDLADVLTAAEQGIPGEDYPRRLLAVLLTYREWALAHPVDFRLIYGNPIPGYQAPYEVTAPAAGRTFAVILNILGRAYAAGLLRPTESHFRAAEALGTQPRMMVAGHLMMRVLGLFNPEVREMIELEYEVLKPYVVDDSKYKQAFGDHSTPLPEAIRQTAAWYRDHLA